MATWEAMGGMFAGGLITGGPVALLYGYILALAGTMATCLSLAELASLLGLPSYFQCFDGLLTIPAAQQAPGKFTGLQFSHLRGTPVSAARSLVGSPRLDGRPLLPQPRSWALP